MHSLDINLGFPVTSTTTSTSTHMTCEQVQLYIWKALREDVEASDEIIYGEPQLPGSSVWKDDTLNSLKVGEKHALMLLI